MNSDYSFIQYIFLAAIEKGFSFCFQMREKQKRPDSVYHTLRLFRIYTRLKTKLLSRDRLKPSLLYSECHCADGELLDLDRICTDGQSVHPDVILLREDPDPLYAMVISSYPYRCDWYERPVFLFSEDGIRWTPPESSNLEHCLIQKPGFFYHSDSSLLNLGKKIALFDRVVSARKDGTAEITVNLLKSRDGIQWTSERQIFKEQSLAANHAKLLSPSFLARSDRYYCWYAEKDDEDGKMRVFRTESTDLREWSARKPVTIHPSETAKIEVWHLDVVEADGSLFMAADTISQTGHKILLLRSEDDGLTWEMQKLLAAPSGGFSARSVYRAAICVSSRRVLLYYTGRSNLDRWQTAVKTISLTKDGDES